MAFRGVKEEQWVFSDQDELENFLSLSEEAKKHFYPPVYNVNNRQVLSSLSLYWDTDEEFQGEYIQDHRAL